MKFNEAIAMATTAQDVEGIPVTKHPIARRKFPAGYVADIEDKPKKRKKKKKKEEEEDEDKRSD